MGLVCAAMSWGVSRGPAWDTRLFSPATLPVVPVGGLNRGRKRVIAAREHGFRNLDNSRLRLLLQGGGVVWPGSTVAEPPLPTRRIDTQAARILVFGREVVNRPQW